MAKISFTGGGSQEFTFHWLMIALVVTLLMPMMINIFIDGAEADDQSRYLVDQYEDFTGSKPTNEQIWALTGIYTPYVGGEYAYTPDGWLYGTRVGESVPYLPSQYGGTEYAVPVQRGEDGLYRYTQDNNYGGYSEGDIYTAVVMDRSQKSDVFFTPGGRTDEGTFFYYDYSGYRYAFQPFGNYYTYDEDGNRIPVIATTTSLSLIWYETVTGSVTGSGISGQLVISSSDYSVAYLDAGAIVAAFDDVNSTSKFRMTFNGVDINLYIRLNAGMISQGMTVAECFNGGYWEILITSLSVDASSYMGTDYSFNIWEILETILALLTFNAASLGLTGIGAILASLVISLPYYAALLSIGLDNQIVLIAAGILAAMQTIGSIWPF